MCLLFLSALLMGQEATPVLLEDRQGSEDRSACSNQSAGSIYFGNEAGFSNDISPDTFFLCFGDEFYTFHNGDQDLSGDSDPSTPGGIGYAWYDSPPAVSGTRLSDIKTDPGRFTHSSAPGAELIVYVGKQNGQARFSNRFISPGVTFNDFYNGGDPAHYWFAPVTFDRLDGSTAVYEDGDNSCVNVNVDEAFSVVYLNPISVNSFAVPTNATGSFTVTGGYPEFDNSGGYRIIIIRQANNQIVSVIDDPAITHGSTVNFSLPAGGFYEIIITDGKSCDHSFVFRSPFPGNGPTITLNNDSGEPEETICIPIYVSNFNNINSFQSSISWDPSVLRFESFDGVEWIGTVGFNGDVDRGNILFTAGNTSDDGVTIPDGGIFAEICFTVIGRPGDCTGLQFNSDLATMEISSNFVEVSGIFVDGQFCVRAPSELKAFLSSCGTLGSQGSISFEVYGGIPPYAWELLDAGMSVVASGVVPNDGMEETADNLTPGTYTLRVNDNEAGFVQQVEVVLHQENLSIVSVDAADPDCDGTPNGSITIQIAGDNGEDPFISWSTGEYDKNTINNLAAGEYSVTVSNEQGCKITGTIELNGAEFELADPVITDAACAGSPTGSVGISVLNPGPGDSYTFVWSNGPTETGVSSTYHNLVPGTYSVSVYDAAGCFLEASMLVGGDKQITAEFTITEPLCFGDETGELRVAAGAAPANPPGTEYTFSWSPNTGSLTSTGPVSVATGLNSDIYSVTITDPGGCVGEFSQFLPGPDSLDIELTEVVRPSCGTSDGIIDVGVSGGTPLAAGGYNVRWNTGQTTTRIENLSAGEYIFTVEDANGCEKEIRFLWEQDGAEVTFDTTAISCAGRTDGAITATINPGNATITDISWSANAGAPQTAGNVTTVSNLGAGIYILNVSDSGGCTATYEFELENPVSAFLSSANLIEPTCAGRNDGSIEVTIAGTNAPFSVNWPDLSLTGNVVTGLPAGLYYLEITDANGCDVVNEALILNDPDSIKVAFFEDFPLSCDESICNGVLRAVASGGTAGTGMYSFAWSTSLTESGTESALTDLCAGRYTVTVSDGSCEYVFDYNFFPENDITLAEVDVTNVSCFGESNGSINVVATGGVEPYEYEWTNFVGPNYQNLSAGNYLLVVRDGNNCTQGFSIIVEEPDTFYIEINTELTSHISCGGSSDGTIALDVFGGNDGNITYNWTPNVSNTNIAHNLSTGTYNIVAVDSKGCIAFTEHTVTGPAPIEFIVPAPEEPMCNGDLTSVTVGHASGGTGPEYTFSVNGGPPQPVGVHIPVAGGTSHNIVVFDSAGCSADTTFTVSQPPAIIVSLPSEILINLGENTELRPVISSTLPVDSYVWTPPTGLEDTRTEITRAGPLSDQDYTLTVTDVNGCEGKGTVFVRVNKVKNIYVPNVFSPNNDGNNDILMVFPGPAVTRILRVKIFNRWGTQILENTQLPLDRIGVPVWDGTYNGTPVDLGVYIYAITVEFADGELVVFKGDVTVLK